MAREGSGAGRRASPFGVFFICAVTVLVCEIGGHWVWPLVFSTERLAWWAGGILDALLLGGVAAAGFWHLFRRPGLERDREAGALIEVTATPLALLDRDLCVLEANAAAQQMFDLGNRGLSGRGLFDHLSPEASRDLNAALKEAVRAGRPTRFDSVAEGRTLRVDALPLSQDGAMVHRLAVHCQDITEQCLLRAAEALGSEVDRRVAGCEDVVGTLRQVCAELVSVLQLRMAWIGRKEENGSVSIIACSGQDMDCDAELRRAAVRWDDTPTGRGPIGNTIRTGLAQVYKTSDSGVQDWQKISRRFGIKAIFVVPLRIQGTVEGGLVLCSRRADAFDETAAANLASAIAVHIGSALAGAADRQQLRLFTTGLEAAVNGIFITNRAGQIEWANQAFCRMCGWSMHEIVGRNPRFLKSGQQDGEFYQAMWSTILSGETWNATTIERRRDGSLYIVEQGITPIRDFRGEIAHFVAVQEDITAMRETEERLHHMAQYDALTDLPNRALFFDRLGLSLAVARRNHHAVALLYIDLDHFKILNDTFGHRVADTVLQQVAVRLRRAMRESDTVARIAGDEFCVIAPQIVVRDDAARVAEKCLEALKTPLDVGGETIHVNISIGISLYPYDGDNQETLIQRADAAMTMVKMQTRNAYKFASVV
jgi:diguanylate cyclase (GGDEF)-like protein/PAS domain S-box-containing protein